MQKRHCMAGVVFTALLVGCGLGGKDEPKGPELIETGSWRIVAVRQGGEMLPIAKPAGLVLADNAMTVETGCGVVRGRYSVLEGLIFSNLRNPTLACGAADAAEHAAVYAALNKVAGYQVIQDGMLSLNHPEGAALMRLTR